MLALKDITVDGGKYQLQQIGSELAERLLIRIIRIIGEPAAMLFASMSKDGKGLDEDITPALAGLMMGRLISGVEEELIVSTISQLLPFIKVYEGSDQAINIDANVHFGGKLRTKYKVIGALLEHNYSDFLEDAGSVLSDILPAKSQDTAQKK